MSFQPPNEYAVQALREQLEAQPWYKRFSNTVTSAVGALSLVLWLVVSSGVELSEGVQRWGAGIVSVLTVLGVLSTKNGVSPEEVDRAEAALRRVE